MTEKRFGIIKTKTYGLYVPVDKMKVYNFSSFEDELDCIRVVNALNGLEEKSRENGKIASGYLEENEQLKKENKELRQDNDIKFWKLQCLQSLNNNQVMLFELSRVIQQGYEVSDKFKQYLDEIKEDNKEIREKHKRLFE